MKTVQILISVISLTIGGAAALPIVLAVSGAWHRLADALLTVTRVLP